MELCWCWPSAHRFGAVRLSVADRAWGLLLLGAVIAKLLWPNAATREAP